MANQHIAKRIPSYLFSQFIVAGNSFFSSFHSSSSFWLHLYSIWRRPSNFPTEINTESFTDLLLDFHPYLSSQSVWRKPRAFFLTFLFGGTWNHSHGEQIKTPVWAFVNSLGASWLVWLALRELIAHLLDDLFIVLIIPTKRQVQQCTSPQGAFWLCQIMHFLLTLLVVSQKYLYFHISSWN